MLSGRRSGISLSPAGREQAAQVAQVLAKLPVAALYASPIERCVETAEVIAADASLDVQIVEGITEVDFGDWQGKLLKDLVSEPLWKVVQVAPSNARFPGGKLQQKAYYPYSGYPGGIRKDLLRDLWVKNPPAVIPGAHANNSSAVTKRTPVCLAT